MKKIFVLGLCTILFSSFFLMLNTSTVEAAEVWTDITLPATINSSGYYRVTNNYVCTTETPALNIRANNVVVNGNGRTITQQNTANMGIIYTDRVNTVIGNFSFNIPNANLYTCFVGCANFNGVEIGNCTFRNSAGYAITLYDGANSKIYNCSFSDNLTGSIMFVRCTSIGVTNCTFTENGRNCIYLSQCRGVALQNLRLLKFSTVHSAVSNVYVKTCSNVTVLGAYFSGYSCVSVDGSVNVASADVVVTNCTFANSLGIDARDIQNFSVQACTFRNALDRVGIYFGSTAQTGSTVGPLTLRDNFFSNNNATLWISGPRVVAYNNYFGDDFIFRSGSVLGGSSQFNISPTNGVRITGGVGQIGGNFWANSAGTGYSQTASNIGGGFAAPYSLGLGQVDNYPLVMTQAIVPTPTPGPTSTATPTPTPGGGGDVSPPGGGGGGWWPSPTVTTGPSPSPSSPGWWDNLLSALCRNWLLILLIVLLLVVVCVVALWSRRR